MNRTNVNATIIMLLLIVEFSGACANEVIKKSEPVMTQDNDSLYADVDWEDDTICVVDGKVFYFASCDMGCKGVIFDQNKEWVRSKALQIIPLSDKSPTKFCVSIPFKSINVDFADEASLSRLSELMIEIPSFERCAVADIDKDSIAMYGFEVDFPSDSIEHAQSIRKWLVEKIAESNSDVVDLSSEQAIGVNYKMGPDGVWKYEGDLMDNLQIARFASDVYFAIQRAEFEDEEYIPYGIKRELNMEAKLCNNKIVTYQECTFNYSGGAHGYYTERLLSYDHVHNQEIDNSYLFKLDSEAQLVDLLVEEAKNSASYKVSEPNILEAVMIVDERGVIVGYNLPRPGLSEEGLVFSFQPYDIGCFSDGAFHFVIPYERLEHLLTDRAKWCIE